MLARLLCVYPSWGFLRASARVRERRCALCLSDRERSWEPCVPWQEHWRLALGCFPSPPRAWEAVAHCLRRSSVSRVCSASPRDTSVTCATSLGWRCFPGWRQAHPAPGWRGEGTGCLPWAPSRYAVSPAWARPPSTCAFKSTTRGRRSAFRIPRCHGVDSGHPRNGQQSPPALPTGGTPARGQGAPARLRYPRQPSARVAACQRRSAPKPLPTPSAHKTAITLPTRAQRYRAYLLFVRQTLRDTFPRLAWKRLRNLF